MLELFNRPFPELETARLWLREMTMADTPFLYQLRTNPDVNRFTDRPKMKTMDEAAVKMQTIVDMIEKNNGIAWLIELKADRRFVGDISFWNVMKAHYRAELGYSSLPEFWGKGLMSEALKAVVDYGFSIMNLHSVEANVNPANTASIRLLEKAQFVREAYFRENYYFDGKFLDSAIYSLVKS